MGAGQGAGRCAVTAGPWNNPKWPEAAAALRERIQDGTMRPGSRAQVGLLSKELGIGRRTAARTLRALADEGLVERRDHAKSYVVLARGEPAG